MSRRWEGSIRLAPLASILCLLSSASSTSARPAQDPEWQAFRKANPFHVQALAMSGPAAGGDRTLIVAEPPPHVALGQIRAVTGASAGRIAVHRHRLGHDGWVQDVVVKVRGDDRQLAPMIARMSRLLFHTSYKAYVLDLPRPPPSRRASGGSIGRSRPPS